MRRRKHPSDSGQFFQLGKAGLLEAYRTMRTIRTFEERLHLEAAAGLIPGFLHLCAGQEASAAGIVMHLNERDRIASTHRGHGHCIAKGMSLPEMAAEIFGRVTGSGKGRGGTMHMADFARGNLGTNGVVGAGAPLICGAALVAKLRGDGSVGVAFAGDGASNQGLFLESLNLAAVWNLPAIFVVENNGYADSTSRDYAVAADSYVDRAAGFGLPGITVDGLDFFAVYEGAGEMIARARAGGGPGLIECRVVRIFGHFEGDEQSYRAEGEIEDILQNRDCIRIFLDHVRSAGVMKEKDIELIDLEASRKVEEAIEFARSSAFPTEAELLADVYSPVSAFATGEGPRPLSPSPLRISANGRRSAKRG